MDGIRGLAILLVLIYHYIVDAVRGDAHVAVRSWLAYAVFPLRLSWSGVDLFFVLSGFLIGGILYDAKDANGYYRTFYVRRFHRILPLYFIWVALFLAGLILTDSNAPALRALFNRDVPVWTYFLFLQNFFTAFHGEWGGAWLAMTWSLAVEEQFYLVLPWAIRRLSLRGIVCVIVGAIVLAPVLRVILDRSGNTFFGPYALLPCRADALGFGVLLALACRDQNAWNWLSAHRRRIQAAFLILGSGCVVLIFYPKGLLMNSVGYSWLAAFYSSLLMLVLVNPGRVERWVFRSSLLTTLGIYAYAVYLFHQGVNGLLHYAIRGDAPSVRDLPSAGVTLASAGITMLLASVSWKFLEKPLIGRGQTRFRYVEIGGNQSKSNRPTVQRTVQRF